jgi:hypothetical protein
MRILSWCIPCLLCLMASAQAPLASDATEALHQRWLADVLSRTKVAIPQDGSQISVGLLSISRDHPAPWMPLIHGDGLGTVTLGQGLAVEGKWIQSGWEVSALITALKDFEGSTTRGRLLEFSLVKQTETGWRWGLEKKPFQWGYGIFGGYQIGDSHDPVPCLILESPYRELSLFGVPLGSWGFDTFLGQLEWDRQIPAWVSTPHETAATLQGKGNLRRPNLSGLRLKAAFGPNIDMNFSVVSEWGGVDASGQNIMKGLALWNYPLAYLGAENLAIAEASGNMSQDHPDPNYTYTGKNFHSLSNALADVEVRVRFPETAANWFGAQGMSVYLSRGATSVNWHWKDFLRHPFSAWSHDLKYVGKRVAQSDIKGSSPDDLWGWGYAQSAPSLAHINDTVGIQWVFDGWDLGIEVSDLHNQAYPASTFRVYGHWRNLSGHSRYGDSLGQPLGGEVYLQGFNLGLRLPGNGKLTLQAMDAIRFYRDSPDQLSPWIPGSDDHFFHTQVDAQWALKTGRIGGSFAYEKHQADLFIPGNRASNWILSLGYAISILKR